MTFRRRRLLGLTVLALCALAGGTWLARLDYAARISTDVLDLIPANDRDADLSTVRELASQAEARTMLFVLTGPGGAPAPREIAQRFAAELTPAAGFAQALAVADPAWRDALGRELFEQRFPLLFPGWLHEQPPGNLARGVAERLKAFLETPAALAYQDLVPQDPLLLLPHTLSRLQAGLALVQPGDAAAASGLIWAQLAVSPLSEAGQKPIMAAIERATAKVRAGFPGLQVAFTGVNRFAMASRARIEREVSWLNAFSLAAVLAVAWIFIRGVHRALHLLPVVGFAVLGAWVATTAAFERVHVMVFALGALLTGVAIDYGFYLYMQPPATPDEDYWRKVGRLAKPLLASCFTTVTGFALLLFSELPMIRQLGVFVGAGLLCALAAAVIYFSTLRNAFLEPRRFRSGVGLAAPMRRRWRVILGVCWLAALPGLFRLNWRDDIRELEVPARDIQAEDARIRAAFGKPGERTVYLTRGETLVEARAGLDTFQRWLNGRGTTANLGAIIPTEPARAAARTFFQAHPEFPDELRRALAAEGFSPEEFAPFFSAYAEQATRTAPDDLAPLVARLKEKLHGPTGLLLHLGAGQNWFVTLASGAPAELPPADTHTVTSNQLQSLNRLFASYRKSALHLSLAGLGIVGLGVFLTYGLRDGLRIFAIPCGVCLGLFGVFGWIGLPLNLFHLLGAFLGVCLTHNYSIFSATSAYRHEPPPVSVRLSALTTAASFGVLACSAIPVTRALGLTVASMVIAALLAIELEHLSALGRRT